MICTHSSPAQQLQSVAERYRSPLNARNSGLSRGLADAVGEEWEQIEATPPGVDVRLVRLEAVLFVAREPLSSRKLSQYANLADATEARTLIGRLNALYDRRGRSFRVAEVAGGYQLLSRGKFAEWIRRLGHVPADLRLSAPAIETLSVIAYRQPVMRSEIESIRGVNCGEILRQLMERDLVGMEGRSEELGRPYLYATTRRFLKVFGLRTLEDLPRAEFFRKVSIAALAPPMTEPIPTHTTDTL